MSAARLGILISGRGSNMIAISHAAQRGDIDASVALVVANNPAAAGVELARSRRLPVEIVDRKDGRPRAERHEQITRLLHEHRVDLVICAGFDEILSPSVTSAYEGRILNIHPSLLPAFGGGMHAVRDALTYGAKVTGCTVHFVTPDLDNGPIVLQRTVPILEGDTEESLAARVLVEEHKALPDAIQMFAENRLVIDGRKVLVLPPVPSVVA
jgi:phosphoribosylglycinamide formyltransferase-1